MLISLILSILLIASFFFSGLILQAIKKIVSLSIKLIFKILNLFGIKIKSREQRLIVSDEFKETYKGITIVKLSKKNLKKESSIDWINLSIFLIAVILYIINFKAIVGSNLVSDWIYSWVKCIPLMNKIVTDASAMNTFYTAALFSIMTFTLTKIWTQWRNTKQHRIEHKQAIMKAKAINIMNSKELLDAAKKKDEENEKELL